MKTHTGRRPHTAELLQSAAQCIKHLADGEELLCVFCMQLNAMHSVAGTWRCRKMHCTTIWPLKQNISYQPAGGPQQNPKKVYILIFTERKRGRRVKLFAFIIIPFMTYLRAISQHSLPSMDFLRLHPKLAI